MHRGQIVLVELDPARGSEQGKTRPAVIVSNEAANSAASVNDFGVVTVVPLTSNTARVRPYQVLVRAEDSGLPSDSKAQAEQVRSVAAVRVVRPLAQLPSRVVAEIDDALRTHLSL
jgi:mRNA interferase MazF